MGDVHEMILEHRSDGSNHHLDYSCPYHDRVERSWMYDAKSEVSGHLVAQMSMLTLTLMQEQVLVQVAESCAERTRQDEST